MMLITVDRTTGEGLSKLWEADMPAWFREATNSIHLSESLPITYIALYDNDLPYVVYTLQELSPTTVEAHIDCVRGTDKGLLVAGAVQIRDHLFRLGYKQIKIGVLTINRGLLSLVKNMGFVETGVRILRGRLRNHPAEWIEMGILNYD